RRLRPSNQGRPAMREAEGRIVVSVGPYLAAVVFAAVLGGCATTQVDPVHPPAAPPAGSAAPDESFREHPPPSGPPITFVQPTIAEAKLANGIRVLVVEQRAFPIVAVAISFDEGADQAPPAVGSMTGAMLMRGTKTRSGAAIAEALADIG